MADGTKPWWQSKTLWTNVVALVAGIGLYVQTKDTTALLAAALAIVNFVLRLKTGQPIDGA